MKFMFNEKMIADGLLPGAVMLERVRSAREKLAEGSDYIHTALGVMYSKTGIKKMAEVLKLESEKKATTPEQSTTQTLITELAKGPEKKRVAQLCPYQGNKKYLRAIEEATGLNLTVHVKDNTNFTRDMTIEVVKGFAGAWDYLGPLPRSRGRM